MNYTWTTNNNSSGLNGWYRVSSSSDGTKLVASSNNYIYTSADSGVTWTTNNNSSGSKTWVPIAVSSDRSIIVSGEFDSSIYTSINSGVTWTERISSGSHYWLGMATSSDGTKLFACAGINNDYIYTSVDSGVTWTTNNNSSGSKNWRSIAASSDGTKLVACVKSGYIYTSIDSGINWTEQTNSNSRDWSCVASNSDGTKLVACAGVDDESGGYIYTSIDSGINWIEQPNSGSKKWSSISSSSNGTKLAACVNNGYIYTSTDSGVNWTQQTSAGSKYWNGISSNSDGTKLVVCAYNSYIYTGTLTQQSPPCFLIGSKILTDKGYISIENLRKGDLVKTLKNDYLPIVLIGKSPIYNSSNLDRIKNRLYNLPKENYPDLMEDLVLTGCHSILVDWITEEQLFEMGGEEKRLYTTDDKLRLFTYLDDKAELYSKEGTFTIYHLALENEDYFNNYGIWANGLLVESCSKRYLIELSGMELIE